MIDEGIVMTSGLISPRVAKERILNSGLSTKKKLGSVFGIFTFLLFFYFTKIAYMLFPQNSEKFTKQGPSKEILDRPLQ